MRNFLKTYDPANPEISQLPPFAVSWGTSVPSNTDGNDGDYYFEYNPSTTNYIYKKISGVWFSVGAPSDFIFTNSIAQDWDGAGPALLADSVITPDFAVYFGSADVPTGNTTNESISAVFQSGAILEPTSFQQSREVDVKSGDSYGLGNTGTVNLIPGTIHNAASTGNVGGVLIGGAINQGSGNCGPITIQGSNTSGGGDASDIILQAGQAVVGGNNGKIKFNDQSGAIAAGKIWTATAGDGSGHWALPQVRMLNSGTNTVAPTDYKLLCDTTDSSASTILFPVGTDGLTYRISGVNGGSFTYLVTPNGTDTMDPSAPTVIGAGAVVEYTFLSGVWFAS